MESCTIDSMFVISAPILKTYCGSSVISVLILFGPIKFGTKYTLELLSLLLVLKLKAVIPSLSSRVNTVCIIVSS